ncbi:MAG: thioredoxin family protein [Thermoproteota archaeon]
MVGVKVGSTWPRVSPLLYNLTLLILLVSQAVVLLPTVEGDSSTDQRTVSAYLFWGEGCGLCEKEMKFLSKLQGKYEGLEVKMFEVWRNQSNLMLFEELCKAYGLDQVPGVPTLFIGENFIIGYRDDETTGERIEELVKLCLSEGCPDPLEKLKAPSSTTSSIKLTSTIETAKSEKANDGNVRTRECPCVTSIKETFTSTGAQPLSGGFETAGGLFLFTVTIGLVDGFNPCSIWVFCLLLSLLLHVSRKRMTLVGGAFVLFSALVYLMFLEAWLTLNQVLRYSEVFRAILGLAAMGVGILGVKDFLSSFKGLSLSIPTSVKPKIYMGMRRLLTQKSSTPLLMSGVASLAFMVNAFELLCTAGLPAAYTRVLSTQTLPPLVYHLYLSVYVLFYMLDELALLAVFALTLKALKLSVWYGRLAKLVGGAVMLALGLILLFKPRLLVFV